MSFYKFIVCYMQVSVLGPGDVKDRQCQIHQGS